MNKISLKWIAILSSVLLLMGFSGVSIADVKQDIFDARQETQIWTTYALSPYLRAHDLKVVVRNGKATLTGTVDEDVSRDLAGQIALGVSGIKDVDNQIAVQSDYSPKNASGYGEAIDDVTITAAVKSRLIWSKYSYISTDIKTKSGRVTLTGAVGSAEAKELAGRLAASTRGVVSVNNQIVVEDRTDKAKVSENAKAAVSDAGQSVADAWITAKVKSNFFYSSNVSGSDIDVSTHSGVVTLKGKVSSGAERALAIELAKNIRGVKSVEAKDLLF
ncbi:MAG TPA: BON domain-containing protein [Cellvibrio sp.]|nr:BON domain-containing protein [Cellvibrio sp.]